MSATRPAAACAGEGASIDSARAARPTNVLVVGVGGQGVVMVSKAIAALCQRHGHEVKQNEVHGMAKRGGVVFSHVRFGPRVFSPTIPMGEADVVVALEWAEGLRWLPFLDPEHGTFIADTQRIVPPFACRDRRWGARTGYVEAGLREVLERVPNSLALDAAGIAEGLGNRRAANTVLLGALSTALEFPERDWLETLEQFVPPRTREVNRRAFQQGRAWALSGERLDESTPAPAGPLAGATPRRVELAINALWCKGCDICVKVCPERCLRLDAAQIAELAVPEACTGCRLCEWLCPDFAIRVHLEGAA